MVSLAQAMILSIVQSITEWLPISSSGHLALLQHFFGFQSISFSIYLHLASILAVIYVFWRDLIKLSDISNKRNQKYLLYLLIGILPIGVIGLFFKDAIEAIFSSINALGIFFVTSGIIVYSAKFAKVKKENLSYLGAMFIGLMQVFAIMPGISRSGTTISAGLMSGLRREDAVRFSFLMAVPLILGASLVSAGDLFNAQIDYLTLTLSFIITFLTSVIAIKTLLRLVREHHFYLFGIYNLLLGVAILIFL